LNGNGKGKARGKPCAGCVGKADNKNPHGQYPNGSDHNAGYECDRNHGIGRSNPAHTGCSGGLSSPTLSPTPATTPTTTQRPVNRASPVSSTTSSESPAAGTKPAEAKSVLVSPSPVESPGVVEGLSIVAPPVAGSSTHPPSSAEFVSQSTPTSSEQAEQGTLPFTGLDLGMAVLVGCLLIGVGLVQRRATSQR
jgi:hypothetical protein